MFFTEGLSKNEVNWPYNRSNESHVNLRVWKRLYFDSYEKILRIVGSEDSEDAGNDEGLEGVLKIFMVLKVWRVIWIKYAKTY